MSHATLMDPDLSAGLRARLEEIEAIKRDARELFDGLSDAQANWRPHPRRWSIAQCLDHIVLSGEPYLRSIEAMIGEARRRAALKQPPFRPGRLSGWFIRSVEPPPRFKAKTFRSMEPGEGRPAAEALARFLALHDALAALIRSAQGIDPHGGRAPSPFFRLLRLTLDQSIALVTTHARRHLWQARQVRQQPAFPAA
ncbi:MAG: DinB family protein [Longimicrobiales bacterium]